MLISFKKIQWQPRDYEISSQSRLGESVLPIFIFTALAAQPRATDRRLDGISNQTAQISNKTNHAMALAQPR